MKIKSNMHSDNYIEANSMQTPPSIVPEWYKCLILKYIYILIFKLYCMLKIIFLVYYLLFYLNYSWKELE